MRNSGSHGGLCHHGRDFLSCSVSPLEYLLIYGHENIGQNVMRVN